MYKPMDRGLGRLLWVSPPNIKDMILGLGAQIMEVGTFHIIRLRESLKTMLLELGELIFQTIIIKIV